MTEQYSLPRAQVLPLVGMPLLNGETMVAWSPSHLECDFIFSYFILQYEEVKLGRILRDCCFVFSFSFMLVLFVSVPLHLLRLASFASVLRAHKFSYEQRDIPRNLF